MLRGIKRSLIRKFDVLKKNIELMKLLKQIDKEKSTIFVLQTPGHTNIGDHAIAEAEFDFLKRTTSDFNIIEIDQTLHYQFVANFSYKVKVKDIILMHGGGNFGNEYMQEEEIRRNTILAFPNNKIISFPQTIYYSDDLKGQRELKLTKEIVSMHSNLTLIAREDTSYGLMKKYFPTTNILLTPDIVLSLDRVKPKLSRDGILMVLRGDDEKVLTVEQHQYLDKLAKKYADKVTYSDMHYHVNVKNKVGRDEVLGFKFSQFKASKLVVTDRLHGMVLAAITQTPCIAFSNYNQKVSGTYEWIKHLNYIRFVDFSSDIESEINYLLNLGSLTEFDTKKFASYFQQISDSLHG